MAMAVAASRDSRNASVSPISPLRSQHRCALMSRVRSGLALQKECGWFSRFAGTYQDVVCTWKCSCEWWAITDLIMIGKSCVSVASGNAFSPPGRMIFFLFLFPLCPHYFSFIVRRDWSSLCIFLSAFESIKCRLQKFLHVASSSNYFYALFFFFKLLVCIKYFLLSK